MVFDKTRISNLALSHLGNGIELTNLDTERSAEAKACRMFFEQARDTTLRDFPWSFARRYAALALVASDPTTEWGYSYRYPSDCLMIRRIASPTKGWVPTFGFFQPRGSWGTGENIPLEVGGDDQGKLIYTNEASPTIEYTALVTEVERYPSDFVQAVSCRLAAYIAPRITGQDPFRLGDRAMQMYQWEISNAKTRNQNESSPSLEPQAELMQARDF